jgi:hypothetical protein
LYEMSSLPCELHASLISIPSLPQHCNIWHGVQTVTVLVIQFYLQ